jgi:rhomboid protease GluP
VNGYESHTRLIARQNSENHRVYTPEQEQHGKPAARVIVFVAVRETDAVMTSASSGHNRWTRATPVSPRVVVSLMSRARLPVTTITLFAITAAITTAQYFLPLLPLFERRPGALASHEYWRLITPIFFHAEGWRQIVFDLSALLILGVIVERIFGGRRLLLLYFCAGITGEIAGLTWKPWGAGSSVAICGLLGAVGAWLLLRRSPVQSRFGGLVILAGAITLTALRDLHGPPILLGILLGWVMQQKGVHPEIAKQGDNNVGSSPVE